MKKPLIMLALAGLMYSCGGSNEQQAEEATENVEMTAEEEAETAEELSGAIQSDKEDIRQSREASLEEIDSLLENF